MYKKYFKNIIEFLAHKITSNVRELEGALKRLVAHSQLVGRPVSIDSAHDVLHDLLRANNRRVTIEEIQKKEFDNNKFLEMGSSNIEYLTLNSINDNDKFETNSVKILYSLPVNSFTLVNDKDDNIYLVKLASSKKNIFNRTDENYLKFANNQYTNSRKTILQSYDQLLNDKYQVQLNQKTIDRVTNYFK